MRRPASRSQSGSREAHAGAQVALSSLFSYAPSLWDGAAHIQTFPPQLHSLHMSPGCVSEVMMTNLTLKMSIMGAHIVLGTFLPSSSGGPGWGWGFKGSGLGTNLGRPNNSDNAHPVHSCCLLQRVCNPGIAFLRDGFLPANTMDTFNLS